MVVGAVKGVATDVRLSGGGMDPSCWGGPKSKPINVGAMTVIRGQARLPLLTL